MCHTGDITKLHGGRLPPVDIITLGSPCQGLSLAGKRRGFLDERSGLFLEAVRVIYEMKEATDGKYPRFALWIENFIKNESSSSGVAVSIDTTNFQIEGKAGSWLAFDSIRLEGQENPQPHQEGDGLDKPRLDNWQKYMENGEYLRSAEISEEQNYNMIDGRKNNGYKAPSATNSMPPKKKPKGRQSVLAKLHKKQAEIAKRSGKREHQQAAENDMERERK